MRTKLSPTRKSALLVLAGLVTVLALLEVATMRSLTPRPAAGPVAQAALVRPENETAMQTGLTPDEYMDLKQSSAQPVTTAQVERMQAQSGRGTGGAEPDRVAARRPGERRRAHHRRAGRQHAQRGVRRGSGGGIWKHRQRQPLDLDWPDYNTQAMGAFAQAPDGRCGPVPARPIRPAAA